MSEFIYTAPDEIRNRAHFKSLDEYHQYGGPPGTGGYWHPGEEELVSSSPEPGLTDGPNGPRPPAMETRYAGGRKGG